MNDKKPGLIARLLKVTSKIEENEVKATVSSFSFVFILMAAYYVLRPVRDAMASDWTDAEVSMLWTINFFISTACVAIYGIAVSNLNFRKLVPSVYMFFAASFAVFYLFVQSSQDTVLVDKTFYVWVSVFALFHVSVFWSFMADTFNKTQAGRLFGVIAAGASLGAIAGPILSVFLVDLIGISQMMLVSALMLLLPIPLILYLGRLKASELHNEDVSADLSSAKIGGNPFVGFKEFFTNPYLLGIGIFIILYTGIGSFVYLEQKNLLEVFTREERTEIYAYRDALVNTITYILAFFLTGRIVSKLGMPPALAIVPILLIFGMLVLAFSPVLLAAVGMHVVLRAGNYGLTRPAREMLFTHVDRESRFKTKPVIDIVAYRGGDVIMGWFFTGLTQGIGLGLAAVAAVGAGIAALWAFVGYRLGKSFDGKASADE
ncbi:MAG: MFS transporter [Proteobacteria bacterium]|jgi:ATP:ADP antiporter, AAA family|nr:MFS transporter [Pseudomonadota bacterium]